MRAQDAGQLPLGYFQFTGEDLGGQLARAVAVGVQQVGAGHPGGVPAHLLQDPQVRQHLEDRAPEVDGVAAVPQGRGALDHGHLVPGAVQEEGERGTGHARA
nr:hypothetical protein [Streptomyces durhamensis]